MTRICNKCKIEKHLFSCFGKHKEGRGGRKAICEECRNEMRRQRYAAMSREERWAMYKASNLKKHYGMTMNQWNDLFRKQGGCCAICGDHQSAVCQGFCVDHNHVSGVVRGLLCHSCNRGIGLLRDNLELLKKAALYIESGG